MPKEKKCPEKNTSILPYSSSKKTTDNCEEPEDASAQTDTSEIFKCEKCGKTVAIIYCSVNVVPHGTVVNVKMSQI